MTGQSEETPGACPAPIGAAALMDYWLGLLSTVEQDPVEEHLFGCDRCGDRLREALALADGLRTLARSGALRVVVGDELVRAAIQDGRRVRQYTFEPGRTVPCTVSADDDLLIARLAVDLSASDRVDLTYTTTDGIEMVRLADIPFRADAEEIIMHESMIFAKAGPTMTLVARLLAVEADGAERLLGEYTMQHTRTIPGPPGWP